ncbi:50S ribosomal protein L33 [Candidatus Saccharibacteria bacterium]|nr:50S ribosomal protein L33 [Candidatus Saccharibacteria bacterium]
MAKSKKSNSKSKRKLVGIVSGDGKTRLYTTVNPQNRQVKNQGKLSLKKYNPRTRQHEDFTETKKNLGRNEVKPKKR